MATSVQHDIMRLVVRGSLELLLHENADMIDIFNEANRPDLIVTLNTCARRIQSVRRSRSLGRVRAIDDLTELAPDGRLIPGNRL